MDSDLKNQQSKEVEGKEMDKISVAGDTTKHEFATKECPVKNVTIFVDRAEVSRTIELDVVEGNSEALLKDLPASADQDSVRVSCYGEATIVEVSYQEKAVNEIDLDDDTERKTKTETEIQDIKNSLKSLNIDKTKLNQRADLIKNQKSLLQKYADCISNTKEDKVADLMEQSKVENMLHFLSVYEEKNTNLENELFEIEKSTGKINSEILVLEKNLKKLKHDDKAMKIERNVSILLEAKVSGKIILVASYVVHEASWKPLYDVRAFNKDNTVQILYFGMIKQNTGEDWENAKLSLSTALPSVGGSPPSLSPQTISIAPTRPVYKSRAKGFGGSGPKRQMAPPPPPPPGSLLLRSAGLFEDNESGSDGSYPPPLAAMPTAEATENMTSTNFEILRPSTIESDNVEHKVSICQLDFSPEFEYIAIPKSVAHAFLKIKVKNESNYALLPGDANVFLDNNFLTKSSLPAVSAMEEFYVSLGVDPSVKVTYKPLKKFQKRTGMITKSEVFNYHQIIEIKNTKTSNVKITVTDQCPRSANDKIKLLLEDPDIKLPKVWSSSETTLLKHGNATINTNNYEIEWVLEIPPTETKTINLKYQVEYPVGTSVVMS